ncbi:MAG: hypothetical protein WDA18_07755 [Candidatus Ratteibacteria bacterium]
MDSRTRMLTAWDFKEPDRVPLEISLYASAKDLPGAEKILSFQEDESDSFRGVEGFDWGFLGLESDTKEEVIEEVPYQYKRIRKTISTPVGEFTAITRHNYDEGDPNDFYWEKRFIATLDDFCKIAEAKREVRSFHLEAYNNGCREIGNRGLPITGLFHPLGNLVRNSTMEEVYIWLMTEPEITMRYLECCTEQICATIDSLKGKELFFPPIFATYALEMLIPPWMGKKQFTSLVFPFDRKVNEAIHSIGGRHRAHCHGNSGSFLSLFADMGIDGVEPLEPPPYGDNILTDAKKEVGTRMLLSGNIVSQAFHLDSFKVQDVRGLVRKTIEEGAPGGGFTLRTTSGAIGIGKTEQQQRKSIECGLAMIEAWREFGAYR